MNPHSESFLGVHPRLMRAERDSVSFRLEDIDAAHGAFYELYGPFLMRNGKESGRMELTREKGSWSVLLQETAGQTMNDLVLVLRRRRSEDRNLLLEVRVTREEEFDQAELTLFYLTEGTDHYMELLEPFYGCLGWYREEWEALRDQGKTRYREDAYDLKLEGRILLLFDGIMDYDDFPEDLYAHGPEDLSTVIWVSPEQSSQRFKRINAKTGREVYRGKRRIQMALLQWLRMDGETPYLETEWRYERGINYDLRINRQLHQIYGREEDAKQ